MVGTWVELSETVFFNSIRYFKYEIKHGSSDEINLYHIEGLYSNSDNVDILYQGTKEECIAYLKLIKDTIKNWEIKIDG
jgi:hypothetical protein